VRKLAVAGLGLCLPLVASVAGCSATGPVGATNAYIPVPIKPGTTDAYLEIRNNGAADELISARLSTGGTVQLRAPLTQGGGTAEAALRMQTVSDIPIPANSTVHLAPNSYHLLITGATGMQSGKAITLTLTFEHAGTINVIALVTDPQSGGSSYFLN
jgi:periplasmic copper chaperone A